MAIVPGIAYLLRHWLYLNYVVTFAGFVFMLLYLSVAFAHFDFIVQCELGLILCLLFDCNH
jgi:hypothetical protein